MHSRALLPRLSLFVCLGLGLGATMGAVCNPQSDLGCQDDEDCEAFGAGGRCESVNFCTFPDESCDSGRRWHERANRRLKGKCYAPIDADTGEDTGTSADTGSSPGPDTAGDTTTGPATGDTGDTTGTGTSAGDSDSDTTGADTTGVDTSGADTTGVDTTGADTGDTGG